MFWKTSNKSNNLTKYSLIGSAPVIYNHNDWNHCSNTSFKFLHFQLAGDNICVIWMAEGEYISGLLYEYTKE